MWILGLKGFNSIESRLLGNKIRNEEAIRL